MKVKCPNCGKNVPFSGNVCPWCKADKGEAKTLKVCVLIGAVLAGVAGGMIFNGGIIAVLGSAFVGIVIGAVLAGYIQARKESHERNAGNPARRQR